MLSGWCVKQQRALLWHASYLIISHSLSYTQRSYSVFSVMHSSLSASSCPIHTAGIICSTALHKYMHVDIQCCSVNLGSVQHLDANMYAHGADEKMKWWWSNRRGSRGDWHHFLLSIFRWSGKSARVFDHICLHACCSLRPEEEMERFSSDSGRPVLWAKVGLMNKPCTM